MQVAKSSAARRGVTFALRQRRLASRNTNRLAVLLRLYSQSWRSIRPCADGIGRRASPISWIGLSSKQTPAAAGRGEYPARREQQVEGVDEAARPCSSAQPSNDATHKRQLPRL